MLTHLHTNTEAWEARKKKELPGRAFHGIEHSLSRKNITYCVKLIDVKVKVYIINLISII